MPNEIVPTGGGGPLGRWNGAVQSPHPPPAQSDAETIDLREALAVLRRHIWLVAGCTLIALATATLLVLRQHPEYRANATIRLKNEREALAGSIEASGLDPLLGKTVDPLLSELEVMRSRSVSAEVVRRAGLRLAPLDDWLPYGTFTDVAVTGDHTPDTLAFQFGPDAYTVTSDGGRAYRAAYGQLVDLSGLRFTVPTIPGEVSSARVALIDEREAIEHVQENLHAVPLEGTDVVDVAYTDADAARARAVVNTAVMVFKEASASDARQLSRRRRVFVEEQLAKTDSTLAVAQAALSEFRRREQVFSARDRFASQQTGMLDLEIRREELRAERRVHAQLLGALRGSAGNSVTALRALVGAPGMAQNQVISTLYLQLVRYQAARDSLTTGRWGSAASNPDVQRLDALIASAKEDLADAATGQLSTIDTRLTALDELQARHAAGLQTQPDREAEEMRLVQRVETAGRLANQLREEYQKAQIAEAIEVGQVEIIDLALLPVEPVNSGAPLKLGLALMLGLMVGIGTAFLREHLNTRITRREELEALLGVPGLAVIPRLSRKRHRTIGPRLRLPVRTQVAHVARPLQSLVTVNEARSPGAEAYRSLRTNLLYSQSSQPLQSLMITSPTASEGKTMTAANLGVAFAQQGLRVLLVDCDLRKARLHAVFGMSRTPGLTEVLAGSADTDAIVRPTGVEGLSIATAGALPPNPAELLGSEPMRALLDQLRSRADLLLVDVPPVLVAGDASIISRMVDGSVVVIRAGQTERAAAHAAISQLNAVGARLVGGVLNDPDGKVSAQDSYSRYMSRYYGADSWTPAQP